MTIPSEPIQGAGSPEGVVAAGVGAAYVQTDAASAGTAHWLKASGTGNTGWISVGATSQADRLETLRRGTVASFREPYDRRSAAGANYTLVSGLLTAAIVPVLAGDSFTKVVFQTASTPATFGSNADGHWYVAVYDNSGALLVQSADQGTGAILNGTQFAVALQSTFTPAADALVRVAIMVYPGTGGAPAMPNVKCSQPLYSGALIAGLALQGISGAAGNTTGVAPAFGSVSVLSATIPYLALSS